MKKLEEAVKGVGKNSLLSRESPIAYWGNMVSVKYLCVCVYEGLAHYHFNPEVLPKFRRD